MTPPETLAAALPDRQVVPLRGRARVVAGLRKPASWLQLIQFGAVGASGFIVNLIVYSALLEGDVPYRVAAVVAFCVAVGNNFTWNRLWTFRHRRDASHAAFQAARFFTVAVTAFLLSFLLLLVLVEGFGVGKIVAQLVAVSLVMPLSFLGNKLWSFR